MDLPAILRNHVNPVGFRFAVTYVAIVAMVYAVTAYNTKPSYMGYEWIPFMLLSTPWYKLDPGLFYPGLVANAFLLYLLGTLLHRFYRRILNNGLPIEPIE